MPNRRANLVGIFACLPEQLGVNPVVVLYEAFARLQLVKNSVKNERFNPMRQRWQPLESVAMRSQHELVRFANCRSSAG